MPDVNLSLQDTNLSVNLNQPAVHISIADENIEVNLGEPEQVNIQIQEPNITVNFGCGCNNGNAPGGATAWGAITGTLADQTDLQTTLDGKSDVGHTHPLSDIEQSGATDGQVPVWDDGAGEWIPGNAPGGAASIIEKTYAEMQTLIAADELTPGQQYNITDAAGSDLGVVLMALTVNELAAQGSGGFLNADFQSVGVYSGVVGETGIAAGTQYGIWRVTFETDPVITTGDIVIWNLTHYQCTDFGAVDGTNPATNTAAYTELPRTVTDVGYVTEWDLIAYSFANNALTLWQDRRRNVIYGNSGISYFRKGDNRCAANVVYGGYINCPNYLGSINNATLYAETVIENISGDFGSYMDNWFLFPKATVTDIFWGVDSYGENNILENGAQLTGITAGANCSISRNTIGQGATMGGSTVLGDGAQMNDLDIRANKQLSNKTLDDGIAFSDKILQITIDGTETIGANIEGNRAQPGYSDIPKTFDITGLTAVDWLSENNYVGIGNLTSGNATEAIDTISNFPTAFPFTLRPAAGLTLTVTGTAIAGIGAGQIALTSADVVLSGDNGEWLELEADPGGGGFLREKNRSGTLL